MLNPTLYSLLLNRFGDVKIVNPGQALVGDYKLDPVANKYTMEVYSRGETYCINCPYCNDSRQRLYINHRYGVIDNITGSDNRYMIRCFNEECPKKDTSIYKDLFDKVVGLLNVNQRENLVYHVGVKPLISGEKLEQIDPPGELVRLTSLPSSHVACNYLLGRGYSIEELDRRYCLSYCMAANKPYDMASNRIIIPIIQDKMTVGWQARYPADLDWKQARIPKYYNLPNMPKRLMLYNIDVAKKQKYCVITEGVTSCWSVYPYGIAVLGKQVSLQQLQLISETFKDKQVIILLDNDAISDAIRLETQLKRRLSLEPLLIELPSDDDPGDYINNKHELTDIILQQAKSKNIDLEGFVLI